MLIKLLSAAMFLLLKGVDQKSGERRLVERKCKKVVSVVRT